ncbi:MAG: hypothetical protein M1833_000462 [Piccolia ochrophora]|nr:MAG: hypothetical protein M1833_000462 [Piccolia ochrophora]
MANYQYSDPRFSTDPQTCTLATTFREVCESGTLEKVVEFVNGHQLNTDYLTHGLDAAISKDRPQVARYLQERGARIVEQVISSARRKKSLSIFQCLVDHGWNVNTPERGGRYMLPSVVQDESLTRWFLDQGADPNLGTDPWLTTSGEYACERPKRGAALNNAADHSTVAVFDLLLERGAKMERSVPLHAAAISVEDAGRIPMMAHLLELGVDINGSDDVWGPYRRGTPLHHAVAEVHLEKVRFLLENGADPHLKNDWGMTPLERAEKRGYQPLLELFEQPS